jgi:hypothetical protein
MMNLPRFTAEAALYRTNAAYTTGTTGAATTGHAVVAPQVSGCTPCLRLPLIGGFRICCSYPPLSCRFERC